MHAKRKAASAISKGILSCSITRSWVFCIDCAAMRVTVAMLGNMYVVGPMWMTLQGSPVGDAAVGPILHAVRWLDVRLQYAMQVR